MIIFGKQPVLYAIMHHKDKIQEIYVAKQLPKEVFSTLKSTNKPIIVLDNKKAQALAHGRNHQGIFAKITPLHPTPLNMMKSFENLLLLVGLSDVGNIGSIVRSAYCLGACGVILAQNNIHQNAIEGIVRSSSGALLDMPFCIIPNVFDCLNELKMANFTLLGADMAGESVVKIRQSLTQVCKKNTQKLPKIDTIGILQSTPLQTAQDERLQKWVLCVGSEGEGLSEKFLQRMDLRVCVRIKRDFDSLNVAHATIILLDRLLN